MKLRMFTQTTGETHPAEQDPGGIRRAVRSIDRKLAIEDVLDTGLPRAYDKPLYERKCSALFEHIYENYLDGDASTYVVTM